MMQGAPSPGPLSALDSARARAVMGEDLHSCIVLCPLCGPVSTNRVERSGPEFAGEAGPSEGEGRKLNPQVSYYHKRDGKFGIDFPP